MIRARALAISVFGVLLTAYPLHAQEISRYREVEMGSPLLSVAGLSGLTPADAKVIHASCHHSGSGMAAAELRERLDDPGRSGARRRVQLLQRSVVPDCRQLRWTEPLG